MTLKVGQTVRVLDQSGTQLIKIGEEYVVQEVNVYAKVIRIDVPKQNGEGCFRLSYSADRFELVPEKEKKMNFSVKASLDLEFNDFGGAWVPARVVADDLKGDFPIVVAALVSPGVESAYRLTTDGCLKPNCKPVLREVIEYRYLPVLSNGMNNERINHAWSKDKDYYLSDTKYNKNLIGHLKARFKRGSGLDQSTVVFEPYVAQYVQR